MKIFTDFNERFTRVFFYENLSRNC